jgi:hypothetical protein
MAVRKRFWTPLAPRDARFRPEFGSFVHGQVFPEADSLRPFFCFGDFRPKQIVASTAGRSAAGEGGGREGPMSYTGDGRLPFEQQNSTAPYCRHSGALCKPRRNHRLQSLAPPICAPTLPLSASSLSGLKQSPDAFGVDQGHADDFERPERPRPISGARSCGDGP